MRSCIWYTLHTLHTLASVCMPLVNQRSPMPNQYHTIALDEKLNSPLHSLRWSKRNLAARITNLQDAIILEPEIGLAAIRDVAVIAAYVSI